MSLLLSYIAAVEQIFLPRDFVRYFLIPAKSYSDNKNPAIGVNRW